MIPGWGRSSWRVPGRTPKLSRSSASVIGPTRVWCSCGQEAGTPSLAWHSSRQARIPIFYTPDKLARGLQSRLCVSYMARASPGRWLCHGPAAHRAAGCGHRPGAWLGASDTLEVREQAAVGGLGSGECARAPGKFSRGRRPGRRAARVSGGSQGRLAGYSAQDRGRGRSAEPRRCGTSANGLRRDLGQCQGPCSTGSNHRRVGAGDGRRRCRSYHWRQLRPAIGPGAPVRQWRRDGRGLQGCGPATLPDHALGSTGDDR